MFKTQSAVKQLFFQKRAFFVSATQFKSTALPCKC